MFTGIQLFKALLNARLFLTEPRKIYFALQNMKRQYLGVLAVFLKKLHRGALLSSHKINSVLFIRCINAL